jgi:hypothetical protein
VDLTLLWLDLNDIKNYKQRVLKRNICFEGKSKKKSVSTTYVVEMAIKIENKQLKRMKI